MTRDQLATSSAAIGAALVFGTGWFHLSAYGSVLAGVPADLQPLMGAAWVFGGISLLLSGFLAVAATPLFVVRRRALLALAALTPLSMAVLQIVYLGFLSPTALLLLDAAVLLTAGQLGAQRQARPGTAA